MGEEFKNVKMCMKTPDGETYEFESVNIECVTENSNSAIDESLIKRNELEFQIKVQHITKKRFIKLIMAKGIAKNGAKDIANYFYKKYGYYNEVFLFCF